MSEVQQQVDETSKSRGASPPSSNEVAPPLISSSKGRHNFKVLRRNYYNLEE